MQNQSIDAGKDFDFGRTSAEYAKYRDIYPEAFYRRIADKGLCIDGQTVLDIGTGTGVLPRNMYDYGAQWTGLDIASNQIAYAKRLAAAEGKDIRFYARPAEEMDFPDETFDVVTACQCFWYFDHETITPVLHRILKPGGRLVILYMAWLPHEDKIAGASEALVLQYSPQWTGAGERKKPIHIPDAVLRSFRLAAHEEYDLDVPFTRETWHGRMKTCRGVGASLSREELDAWEREHRTLLEQIAPERFTVRHYAAMAILEKREGRLIG